MKTKKKTTSLWSLLKGANVPKWIIIVALLLSLLETAAGLVVPLFTANMVDQLATSRLELSLIALLGGAFIIQTIASGFSFYLMTYIGERMVASLRRKLWEHSIHLPIPFFDKHQSGETMSRITQDTNIVKTLITQHIITFITGMISIIGAIIILLMIDWRMTLIMLIAVPLAVLIIMPLGQKIYKVSLSTQDQMADFSSNLGRVLSDIRLVKAYQAEKTEIEKGNKNIQRLFQFGLKEAKIQAVVSPFMTFIMMFVLVVLIGYGGVRVASGELSAGSLVAIIIYMFQIVVPFTQMASFFTAYQKAMGATERIQDMLNTPTENMNEGTKGIIHPEEITFNQLQFSYKDDQIIKDINLHIPAGKTTAFVGPSGSGKTTLFALLERFYGPNGGLILLNGKPAEEYALENWREQIGYVSQESPLMSGTIRENLTYGTKREISEEELLQATTQAHAAEFIERLPNGLNTDVGERGIKLSGGQRQRIAIARAIIRDPKILLLDEATSNLDSSSEQLVQSALQNLMKGRTTLVIAHRLSTIIDADQIIVLENGKITGKGTHDELMQSHPLYVQLATKQLNISQT
ncbi:ABC transporter ATP-binding protein [Cytobacillus sp. FSL W7-1323]|uniref:Multidrug ABC transporter permease n=1 Tax=Cytobacillus kochii TaxID=859143 RepID=A0A248TI63_9BACI|nr:MULTISPECIES: ABC transporter ATP-binding protein [Cytobacillus]ASV67904.1 multidrug ABC transporter permease [Cytobacillus kochii]MDQ0185994.1 ATP-binding cassette subfamily B protein AbcA/BmrA [Cytobacillus kochii]MEA1853836.1 ABC transporter ATP-binding protein [Cytobacillus sp. OWB-43]